MVEKLFQFLLVRLKGAGIILPEVVKKFQFLLVRLKGYYGNLPCFRTLISIPFGAIKS